jgi:hypothetical protein
MAEINRSLIIVKPKQPFLDWVRSIEPDNDTDMEDITDDPTAYLIPELGIEADEEDVIEWCADFIFEYELSSWYTEEDLWPVGRDVPMFREWFEVKFHSLVNDVVGDVPLLHVDYDDEADDVDPNSNGH